MAIVGEKSLCLTEPRSLLWIGRGAPAVPLTGTREHDVNMARRDTPLDYAVMTEESGFPAGWVRFNKTLEGYVFSTLLPGRWGSGTVHAEPGEAVPTWIGSHTLKAIHPIPEELTGDMAAAAPAMLAILKQVQAVLAQGDLVLPGVDLDDLEHVLAIAEGRS